MVFCSHCGAENADSAKFCAVCGKELLSSARSTSGFDPFDTTRNDPNARATVKEKETLSAILLSFLFPGLGLVYIGKNAEGLTLIFLNLICFMLGFLLFFPWAVCVLVWVFSMVYSYTKSEEYNRILRSTGQPPW